MPGQVLHGGDLICEGFVLPLKVAPKAAGAAAVPRAPVAGAPPDAAPAAAAAPAGQAPFEAAEQVEPEWAYDALETVEAPQFYNAVSRTGIQYGPHFRMVRRTNIAPDTAAQLRCGHVLHACQP